MDTPRAAELVGVKEELVTRACSISVKAHKQAVDKPYIVDKPRASASVVFAFPGSWSPTEWFTGRPFGATSIGNSDVFCPRGENTAATSLRSIGTDELATVNEAFLARFHFILANYSLQSQVEKVLAEKKQVVFTGHSSGGAIAILATVWFLENYLKPDQAVMPPVCMTFGSPLVANFIFSHALARESWSKYFIHFVLRYDIVPRITLAPLSSIEAQLPQILSLLKSTSAAPVQEPLRKAFSQFYLTVMRNASCVTSQASCKMMGNTNPLMETVASFIERSPFRPFGIYVFCTGNGKLVVVKNPDAVLQILFYSLQLNSELELSEIGYRSFKDHWNYQNELQEGLCIPNFMQLDKLDQIPLTSTDVIGDSRTSMALKDLGLSARARLRLRAVGEAEKQKRSNQERIDGKKKDITDGLDKLFEYQKTCAVAKVGYYDAFKISKDEKDFHANVTRSELAGIWDEIIEMLKRYELPDGFEVQKEWVELGTRYRRIVEPLDIANYYRHAKDEDTGPYLVNGRPKRYRYTQKWREHALRVPPGSSLESCLWAEVEELNRGGCRNGYEVIRERVLGLEKKLDEWIRDRQFGDEVFFDASTFVRWWKTLPYHHRQGSCIARFIRS